MENIEHKKFIDRTIELAEKNVLEGGRPFACVVVDKDGKIIGESANQVAQTHNPTSHAEILAIAQASKNLGSEHFYGCTFYILTYPCPMCMAAMYYCSPDCVVFVTTRDKYSKYYTDSRKYFKINEFYHEIGKSDWKQRNLPMKHVQDDRAIEVYKKWNQINVKSNNSQSQQSKL